MRSLYLIGLYTLVLNYASSLKLDQLKFERDSKLNDEIMSSEADKIINLPGTEHIPRNYDMYSGYLDASEDDHLFYWFVENCSAKKIERVKLRLQHLNIFLNMFKNIFKFWSLNLTVSIYFRRTIFNKPIKQMVVF